MIFVINSDVSDDLHKQPLCILPREAENNNVLSISNYSNDMKDIILINWPNTFSFGPFLRPIELTLMTPK